MSPTGTLYVCTLISLVTFILAIGFLLHGAWPILLFSGAELLAIGYHFFDVVRHASDYERLTLVRTK